MKNTESRIEDYLFNPTSRKMYLKVTGNNWDAKSGSTVIYVC